MSHFINGPTWGIRCDRPDCVEFIDGIGKDASAQRRHATAAAEIADWQISNHADIPLDFCPGHLDHARSVRMDVTRLYIDGVAVKRQRLA